MNFDYLHAHDERAVRTALLTGLGLLRSRQPDQTTFEYVKVVHQVATALLSPPASNEAANVWRGYQNGYHTTPQGSDEYPDNRKLLSALWALIGEGVLFPRMKTPNPPDHPHVIDRLVLTARGERLVAGGDAHPLHPGFIKRFRDRTPGVTDEVLSRMEDAVSCVEKSLLRAALVMVGLAAEETLIVTHAAMVNQNHIGKAAGTLAKAKNLLSDIEKAVASWTNANDEQHRLKMAITAVESIRTERNKASHPGVVVDDAAAVEEILVLASRQLPVFWEIPIDQAVKNGFTIP